MRLPFWFAAVAALFHSFDSGFQTVKRLLANLPSFATS
jgi:hypothetical protein